METTSLAYLRGLGTTPPTAVAGGSTRATRVKLVFLDEVGAFIRRHRGFSACWYLIPRNARLVGDLVHEILEEFELRARCPLGIELLLEGFHVLSNQEIDMVRDNDTLAVQCGAFFADDQDQEKQVSITQRLSKRKRTEEKGREDVSSKKQSKREKTEKNVADAEPKKTNGKISNKTKSTKPLASAQKQCKQTVLDFDDDDSSSSSSDSSSEEDVENVRPPRGKTSKNAFRAVVKDTVEKMKKDVLVLSSASSITADSSSSSDSDSDSSSSSSSSDDEKQAPRVVENGRKPTKGKNEHQGNPTETRARRRRRPRRRPKNGATASNTKESQPKVQAKPSSESTTSTSADNAKEMRPLRIRGVPPNKTKRGTNHVRFDTENSASTAPELTKYGPTSSNSRPNKAESKLPSHNSEALDADSKQPIAKKPVKEMWKRPYEVISSIHDIKTDTAEATKTPTLEALLSTYPLKPTDTSSLLSTTGLQTDDIVAYKTLTLCMETFEPVVSDWHCGQVVDVLPDEDTVTLIPYSWVRSTSDQFSWKPSQPHIGEDASVTVVLSEISEVRYLEGPTKTRLGSA